MKKKQRKKYVSNTELSEDKVNVSFTNRSYFFLAGLNKYAAGTNDHISGGVFGLYAAEDISFNGELLYAKDQQIERITSKAQTTYFKTRLPAFGKYYIREITAPAGYAKDETKYPISAETPGDLTGARLANIVIDVDNNSIDETSYLVLYYS